MNKLKEPVADTPNIGILQRIFGKTIEWVEIIAVVVVAIAVAKALGVL